MSLVPLLCSIISCSPPSTGPSTPLLAFAAASPQARVAAELSMSGNGYRLPFISVRMIPRRPQSHRMLEMGGMLAWEREVCVRYGGDITQAQIEAMCEEASVGAAEPHRTQTVPAPMPSPRSLEVLLWWLRRPPVAAMAVTLHNTPKDMRIDLAPIAALITSLHTRQTWEAEVCADELPALTVLSLSVRDSLPIALLSLCPSVERLELHCAEGYLTAQRVSVNAADLVARLPRLRSLRLSGFPAIAHLPTAVRSAAALEELVLDSVRHVLPSGDADNNSRVSDDGTASTDRPRMSLRGEMAVSSASAGASSLRIAAFPRCSDGAKLLLRCDVSAVLHLAFLDLSHTELADMHPIVERCPRLEELRVVGCRRLSSLGDVGRLEVLRVLLASGSGVTELGTLPDAQRIDVLDLSFTPLQGSWIGVTPDLHHCRTLTTLKLCSTTVAELGFVNDLPCLTELDCSHCAQIATAEPLIALTSLRRLSMANCRQLVSIEGLGNRHSMLMYVDFSFCERLNPLPEVLAMPRLCHAQLRRSRAAVTSNTNWSRVSRTLTFLDVSFTAVTKEDTERLHSVVPALRSQRQNPSVLDRVMQFFGFRR